MAAVAWLIAIPLSLFALRRYCLVVASLLPRTSTEDRVDLTVSILIAARNEETALPKLLIGLDELQYPAALLQIVIVSDGSVDRTAAIAERWAAGNAQARVLHLPTRCGKATALQIALETVQPCDAVVVVDADVVPQSQALASLLGALRDPRVGAACGYPDPGVNHRTIVARYAAIERWVFHLVTLAGKDRLGLQPSVIGAFFCVRKEALVQAGGFTSESVAEDIDLSQRLNERGWKTRWIGEARVTENVPQDVMSFMAQRTRWTRGLLATGKSVRTVEDAFVAAGYLDRALVLATLIASMAGIMPWSILLIYICAPALMVAVGLQRAKVLTNLHFWWAIIAMITVDIYISVMGIINHCRKTAITWSGRKF